MAPNDHPVVLDHEELVDLIKSTVHETLVQIGIDIEDPIEVQRDIQFLRDWRESTESIKKKALLVVVGVAVIGALSLLWVAVKSLCVPK